MVVVMVNLIVMCLLEDAMDASALVVYSNFDGIVAAILSLFLL